MGQFLCPMFKENVTVNGLKYVVVKGIGEGAFSYVQHVTRGGEHFALKRVLIQVPETELMIEREVKAHSSVNHPNVMPLIDHEVVVKGENKEARLLFPYHKLGTVQEMIEVASITKAAIPEKDILFIFRSLCRALYAFHSLQPPYAHRDIKPHNLLILERTSVVLMDLGSTSEANIEVTSRNEALALQERFAQECTAAYRAPELFEVPSECTITASTDVWSLGCVLYALAYGDSPCDGSALSAVSPNIKIPQNSGYSSGLNNLILYILKTEPSERPTVKDILEQIDKLIPRTSSGSSDNEDWAKF